MSEKKQFRAIKGVRDILPPESALWSRVEQTARDVFETYNFGEIRLPIFEETELFARSVGEDTDIVSKEMYTFEVIEPSVARLDALRQFVSTAMPQSYNLVTVDELKKDLEEFLKQVKDLGVEPELANDSFNRHRLEVLKKGPQRLEQLKNLVGTQNYQEIFDSTVQAIQISASNLRLGQRTTLRPEATASVVRTYIEHGMHTWPSPVKLYYIGPMFRRERPQKGRYRQFYQIGAEVLAPMKPGGYGWMEDAATDAEVIEMLAAFFAKVGLEGTTLYINSIGDKECRPPYVERLRSELIRVKDKLGADSQRRIETNPLRVLDSKLQSEQGVIETLPRITEHLCEPCRDHYAELKRQLALRKIAYQENWRLVRGLDYYTRTTFEITAPGLGAQDAVCGGGRYDGLVELLGGPRGTKGIGFAIGEDRLILALQHVGVSPRVSVDVLIAWRDREFEKHAHNLARILRGAGLNVEVPARSMDPREGIGLANKRGIPIGVVLGQDEISAGAATFRFLADQEQVSVANSKAAHLGRILVLRNLLERGLSQVAKQNGIDTRGLSIPRLGDALIGKGLLGSHTRMAIQLAGEDFNKAIHGQELSQQDEAALVGRAIFLLRELSSKYGMLIPELKG